MRRRLIAAWFATALALLLTAIPAAPDPVFRYSWDPSEPFVHNRDYQGPGLYTQTLSITGLPAGTKSMSISIEVNTPRLTAWGFFPGGCPGPSRLAARPFVAGCDTIPGLDVLAQWLRSDDGATDDLYLLLHLDPAFVPDPLQRYGLATITFDHQLAETDCFFGPDSLCFLFGVGVYQTLDRIDVAFADHDRLTWNHSSAVPDCSPQRQGFVAARPSSWGRVKSLYR